MRLDAGQLGRDSLAAHGHAAIALLTAGDFDALAVRYGYAVAYGRAPATAIREDVARGLADIGVAREALPPREIRVQYFKPGQPPFFAAVECRSALPTGSALCLSLIVTGDGDAYHATLEVITALALEP